MELRTEGVSRRFFRGSGEANFFYAVEKTDFILPAGKLTEITGRSGSGKSTLLNLLAGLLEPSEGKVYLDDIDLYSLADGPRSELRNRSIGIVPQGQTGLHSLTVLENVKLPFLLYGETASDETALELPLSRADRPGGWDERVLPHLGFEILAERVFRPQLLLPLGEARGYYTEFFIAAVKTANGA